MALDAVDGIEDAEADEGHDDDADDLECSHAFRDFRLQNSESFGA